MPVSYRFDGSILEMTFDGDCPPDHVTQQFLNALADPACPERVVLLADVSKSTSLATRPAEDIQRVAAFLGPHAERISRRCAVLAAEDIQFGLSRLGAVYSETAGVATRVFRNRDEALAWLLKDTGA
ncbi:MAG TPA: hypothetical protein VFX92_03040 [Candidatus Krumholzibacteria bacterium]|nr:hypothetical protein [Candidatus Krumholzibacteria bacterium]